MKRYSFIKLVLITVALILIYGCNDLLTSDSTSNGTGTSANSITISIVSPVTNGTVGYTGEQVEYKVNGGTGCQHIELWINGAAQAIIFPSGGGTTPEVKFEMDKSLIGQKFDYYLFYFDNNGTSALSATQKNITISDVRIAPYPPYNLALTPLVGGKAINIAWKDSSSFDVTYQVGRSLDASFTTLDYLSPILPAKTFNFTDTTHILPGVAYYYKVKAFNTVTGNSSESKVISTTGGSSSSFLLTPPDLLTAKIVGSSAQLTWRNNSNNYTYLVVERRNQWAFSPDRIAALHPDSTAYFDSKLPAPPSTYQIYYYRIKAFSATDSSWTDEVKLQ